MRVTVLFISYFPCMIGVALCNGGGVYNLVNPYQQAQIRLPPPPPPYYPPHPYGYGQGGRIGIGGIILGLLGFFFIMFIVIMGFGLLSRTSKHTSDTHAVVKAATISQPATRPVIVISGNGVTHT
ncbi:uncharacterized protein LOC132725535 [Ruditapes philippinarum]|uniref:uncharacterized protein LOC132725535 n=1 Tax=Ruditapes philippinarum TaxID=129788 RepID=UPI00295AE80F|nr:uncharacterized protein LOC132725535 [Ruditapes philippinarum]